MCICVCFCVPVLPVLGYSQFVAAYRALLQNGGSVGCQVYFGITCTKRYRTRILVYTLYTRMLVSESVRMAPPKMCSLLVPVGITDFDGARTPVFVAPTFCTPNQGSRDPQNGPKWAYDVFTLFRVGRPHFGPILVIHFVGSPWGIFDLAGTTFGPKWG